MVWFLSTNWFCEAKLLYFKIIHYFLYLWSVPQQSSVIFSSFTWFITSCPLLSLDLGFSQWPLCERPSDLQPLIQKHGFIDCFNLQPASSSNPLLLPVSCSGDVHSSHRSILSESNESLKLQLTEINVLYMRLVWCLSIWLFSCATQLTIYKFKI